MNPRPYLETREMSLQGCTCPFTFPKLFEDSKVIVLGRRVLQTYSKTLQCKDDVGIHHCACFG